MTGDELSADIIGNGLGTRLVGKKIIYHPRVTSTMDIARQEAQQGAAEGTVIIADEQVTGKGRLKRIWLSPGGNVAMSIILYPSISSVSYLIMLASLAVARSIEAVTGLRPQIKWPNDVLINDKKVCGILSESDVRGKRVVYAIIGIGLNVTLELADIPELLATASSLTGELGRGVSRVDVTRQILIEIDRLYSTLPSGEETVYKEWRDRLVTLGRRVQVKSGTSILEGIAESVVGDGSLLLRLSDGSVTKIIAGDVTLRDK
ncbi:biotin--[acetyl-CoA-carboxylase] ligase [Chloroflexota bacterium]